jgi:hypothetical protein
LSVITRLVDKLKVLMIPELLEANEVGDGEEEVSFHLLSELTVVAHRHPA